MNDNPLKTKREHNITVRKSACTITHVLFLFIDLYSLKACLPLSVHLSS
jgi:hypothetical protein